jgi:hypothetical protein
MKRFKKLPVILGIVLSVMLVFGGVAFAVTDGFQFTSGTAQVTVKEAMSVEIDGTGIAYLDINGDGQGDIIPVNNNDGFAFTMDKAYAGEFQIIPVTIKNASYEDLFGRIDIEVSSTDGEPTDLTITNGWHGAGENEGYKVPGRRSVEDGLATEAALTKTVGIMLNGDAPAGATYTITFYFYRY